MALKMFIVIFWVVMLCGLVGITIVLEECITYIVRVKLSYVHAV
jgi:hypothetical protein